MPRDFIAPRTDRILITGSNGFIGAKVVEILLEYGFSNLRCFVRPSSHLGRLNRVLDKFPADVELVSGDLLSRDDCARATDGVSIICHLAAGFDKSFAGAFMNSALATRNLAEAFLERGLPKRFVNVSSFAVYSNLTLKRRAPLDEDSPLEDAPQERYDAYGFGKLKQEELIRSYGRLRGLPYVILRPGAVFGPGKKALTGRIGVDTFGFFIHVGGGDCAGWSRPRRGRRDFQRGRRRAADQRSVSQGLQNRNASRFGPAALCAGIWLVQGLGRLFEAIEGTAASRLQSPPLRG
jgi:nucleoside-diphosphate-sugar epimerase